VNPYEYNTRPFRNLYQDQQYSDSLTSMLSKENYLCPSPEFCTPEPERMYDGSSSGWSSPSPSFEGQRFYCSYPNCAYSVIGYPTLEDLQLHHADGQHFPAAPEQPVAPCEPPTIFGWHHQQVPAYPMQPEIQYGPTSSQQSCPCQHCNGYQPELAPLSEPSMHIQMPLPPTIVGYNGPEVENLSWREGEIRPQGAYPAKRQRMAY